MSNKEFLVADEVAEIMRTSKGEAYKIMRNLNRELEGKGYITIRGRINREYFEQRTIYKQNQHQ